jgi:hypothetical protein
MYTLDSRIIKKQIKKWDRETITFGVECFTAGAIIAIIFAYLIVKDFGQGWALIWG